MLEAALGPRRVADKNVLRGVNDNIFSTEVMEPSYLPSVPTRYSTYDEEIRFYCTENLYNRLVLAMKIWNKILLFKILSQ